MPNQCYRQISPGHHLVPRRRQELNGSDSGGLRVQLDGRREDEVGCSLSDSHAAGAQRPELTSPRLLILSHGIGWFVVGRWELLGHLTFPIKFRFSSLSLIQVELFFFWEKDQVELWRGLLYSKGSHVANASCSKSKLACLESDVVKFYGRFWCAFAVKAELNFHGSIH